jgi:serine-type D-Ala-D-Ala carboxypeptidase (penicillin-binding protein 5/6)
VPDRAGRRRRSLRGVRGLRAAAAVAAVSVGAVTVGATGPASASPSAGSAAGVPAWAAPEAGVPAWPAPGVGVAAPAPRPTATPTPEPPLPGQGPDGEVVGGPRLAGRGVVLPPGARALPKDLSARSWLLADLDTGQVLAARDPHGRYPPASTLKVLTALTLLPKLKDRRIKITATDSDVTVDGTRVGLVANGRYTLDVLFQAMLMASANDAANALARAAGGAQRTVAEMDAVARRLQALDTHAATPSGLDGPGQLTSAYDLVLITRAALARSDFRKYATQRRGWIPAQKPKFKRFEFANGNRLLYEYPGTIGGKNGFTDAARHTFVGAARHGQRRLVVSLLYGEQRPVPMSVQAARLLDWGFALSPAVPSVGMLVDPVDPSATPAPTPTPSPAPELRPATGPPAPDDGTPPLLPVAAAIGVALVLAGAGYTVTRRRP